MTDTTTGIRLTPGQYLPSLTLRATTALTFCTEIVNTDDGGVVIERNWPTLSTGEELLWRVLAWLNGASDMPSPTELDCGLDDDNLASVRKAVAAA